MNIYFGSTFYRSVLKYYYKYCKHVCADDVWMRIGAALPALRTYQLSPQGTIIGRQDVKV